MNVTSVASYKKHRYSGPRKSRKRVSAQLKRFHGDALSREDVWRKRKKETPKDEAAGCARDQPNNEAKRVYPSARQKNAVKPTTNSTITSTPKSSADNEAYCKSVDSNTPEQTSSVFAKPMELETPSIPTSPSAHSVTYCDIESMDNDTPVETSSLFTKPIELETMECETLCYSFLDKCRLCLLNLGVTNIVETNNLLENIFVCTGLRITSSDNLPQKVCAECLETIERATKLRHLAIMNDNNLRSLLPPDAEEATPTMADPLDLADVKPIITVDCNVSVTEGELEQKTDKNKNCKETPSETEQSEKEKKLVVRNDLYEKPTSSTVADIPNKSKSNTMSTNHDLLATSSSMIVIRTQEDFNKHQFSIESETDCFTYECVVCSKVFCCWKQLYLHLKFHKMRLVCPLDACGKMFVYKAALEKHIQTHTAGTTPTVHICNKSLSQQDTIS